MSAWEDMKSGFRSVANKVICRTDELAEEASLSIKKKTVEAHLAEAYERLGRACYPLLTKEDADPRSDAEVLAAMDEVKKHRGELNTVNETIRRFKEETKKKSNEGTEGKQDKKETSTESGPADPSEETE